MLISQKMPQSRFYCTKIDKASKIKNEYKIVIVVFFLLGAFNSCNKSMFGNIRAIVILILIWFYESECYVDLKRAILKIKIG